MKRFAIYAVVVSLMLSLGAGTATAKGKPVAKPKPQKGNPVVTYVFQGEVVSADGDSVVVAVRQGNSFAKRYVGQRIDFAADAATKVVEDDATTNVSELDAGDRALVQVRAPKNGAASFTARMIVAESPVPFFFDADGDGIGAGESELFFDGEEPEGYVGTDGDNCAEVANPDQADTDADGVGDACEEPAATEPVVMEGTV